MKKVSQPVDDILLDYLDGKLTAFEKERTEQSLLSNPAWQNRLEELRLIHSFLSITKPEQPSRNFTEAVMGRLNQYPAQAGFSMRNGIFLLMAVLVAVGIATVLLSSGAFDNATTNIDLNQVELSKRFIKTPLPSFAFNAKLIVNIIIILNLGLAWMVLDRVILKPFFQRRLHTGS